MLLQVLISIVLVAAASVPTAAAPFAPSSDNQVLERLPFSPGDPAILDSWGWLLYKQGKSRAAVRVLDQAARYAPREPEILVHLAAAWISDGAPRTAAGVLDAAAALHPRPQVQRLLDAQRARLPR